MSRFFPGWTHNFTYLRSAAFWNVTDPMFADNPVSQMMLGLETEQELWGQSLYCVHFGDGQWSAPET